MCFFLVLFDIAHKTAISDRFSLGTIDLGTHPNVLVSAVMHVPTLFAKRPSSFVNEVYHVVAVGPFMRCLYSCDDPVVGSRTELIVFADS